MICPNCKKQIPDEASRCSFCDFEIKHEEQLPREIKHRRIQRWIFYVVIAVLFSVLIAFVVYEKNKGTKLLLEITNIQADLEKVRNNLSQKEIELDTAKNKLNVKEEQVREVQSSLSMKESELKEKTNEYKEIINKKDIIDNEYKDCKVNLSSSEANIYNLILKLSEGITNENLAKIPLADANMVGDDLDFDGLSDVFEQAIGTDKRRSDTDADGYKDKEEILKGYNPLGEGVLGIDYNFANNQKGKILLQIEGNGEAWYVSPSDAKRYFLGRSEDGFQMMRNLDYWTKKNKELLDDNDKVVE